MGDVDLIFTILTFFIIILNAKWPDFVRRESELFFRRASFPWLATALIDYFS